MDLDAIETLDQHKDRRNIFPRSKILPKPEGTLKESSN